MDKNFKKNISILELGCNSGRNLKYLKEHNFNNIEAVEINKAAIKNIKKNNSIKNIKIYNSSIQEFFKKNKKKYELIFSMAVLQHIPYDCDDIFKLLNCNYFLTIEDEGEVSKRHFPRNYKNYMEKLGFKELFSEKTNHGLNSNFKTRLFKKIDTK